MTYNFQNIPKVRIASKVSRHIRSPPNETNNSNVRKGKVGNAKRGSTILSLFVFHSIVQHKKMQHFTCVTPVLSIYLSRKRIYNALSLLLLFSRAPLPLSPRNGTPQARKTRKGRIHPTGLALQQQSHTRIIYHPHSIQGDKHTMI